MQLGCASSRTGELINKIFIFSKLWESDKPTKVTGFFSFAESENRVKKIFWLTQPNSCNTIIKKGITEAENEKKPFCQIRFKPL